MAIAIKKTKLDAAVRRTAEIIEEHLGTLPPPKAKVVLKDIRKLAAKSSRSVAAEKLESRNARRRIPRDSLTLVDS
jgi:hypothetical protein